MNGTERIGTRRILEEWGFTDQDIQKIGWPDEQIYAECKGWIDAGHSKPESVKEDFEEMFPGLFGGDPSEEADVFQEFGFYTVPDLTDEERKPQNSSLTKCFRVE